MKDALFPTRRMTSLMRGPLVVVKLGSAGARLLPRHGPLVVVIGLLLVALAARGAFALTGDGHKLVAEEALSVLEDIDSAAYSRLLQSNGTCGEVPGVAFRVMMVRPFFDPPYSELSADQKIVLEVPAVDGYPDLEFVDVEGGLGSGGRDNPHAGDLLVASFAEDESHYTEDLLGLLEQHNLTCYNHFIDIKKGPGLFDDFDGYAYHKGSASRNEYEDIATLDIPLVGEVGAGKVDERITWWFNDDYVHAPGRKWYQGCSPSVERYSFPRDRAVYSSVKEEARARFPLANSTGESGKGIPYSVFMPVDNMARYWYGRFVSTSDPATLGPVLHAIQDASVPHHAAGYSGNWHRRYETDLDSRISSCLADATFIQEVKALVESWSQPDPSPPSSLAVGDYTKQPAINWPVQHLVTWVALNAYREYDDTYNHFSGGYSFSDASAKKLIRLAAAMSALALRKAASVRRGLIVRTLLSNGDGTWRPAYEGIGWGRGVHQHPTLVGHVDGGGLAQAILPLRALPRRIERPLDPRLVVQVPPRTADLIFPFEDWRHDGGLTVRALLSKGDGTWTQKEEYIGWGPGVHGHPTHAGDVDGDGKTDLIFPFEDWRHDSGLSVRVLLSKGDGTWTQEEEYIGWGPGVHRHPTHAGHVDEDGKTDLIFPFEDWRHDSGLGVRVLLSNGDGTWTQNEEYIGWGTGMYRHPTHAGDVDEDGKTDLIFPFEDWRHDSGLSVRVLLSKGDGTWTQKEEYIGWGPGVHRHPTHAGDVDGDGKTDLIFPCEDWRHDRCLTVRALLSKGDGTWVQKEQHVGWGPGVFEYPTLVGDVDGDGKTDLVFPFQYWWEET